jgi:hypothetical protein
MIRGSENKKQGLNEGNIHFKHYKVMVKILHEDKVEYQNLEIFTTGLTRLLEMRKIHNKTFRQLAFRFLLDNLRNN